MENNFSKVFNEDYVTALSEYESTMTGQRSRIEESERDVENLKLEVAAASGLALGSVTEAEDIAILALEYLNSVRSSLYTAKGITIQERASILRDLRPLEEQWNSQLQDIRERKQRVLPRQ